MLPACIFFLFVARHLSASNHQAGCVGVMHQSALNHQAGNSGHLCALNHQAGCVASKAHQ